MKGLVKNMKKKIFSFLMATMMMVSAVSVLAPTTVKAEEVATGRTVPHYTLQINGGDWDGTHYTMNGQVQKDVFFCDGTYTYYLQADGTPMKDRLTYHPDGEKNAIDDSEPHWNLYDNLDESYVVIEVEEHA